MLQGHDAEQKGKPVEVMVLSGQPGSDGPHGTLHIWLGRGGGWSVPLPLHEPQTKVHTDLLILVQNICLPA